MKIIKVLVDEMPSGCKRCNFCVAKMYCSLLEDRKTTVPDEPYKRRADCPLVYDFGDRETNALNKRIAELEAERRWIPVSERLPEVYRDEDGEFIPFLVCENDKDCPYRALYDGLNWGDGMFVADVTHWMPLPKLPEVQE